MTWSAMLSDVMTASTPSRTSTVDTQDVRPGDSNSTGHKTSSGPLGRALTAARRLLGRDRSKTEKKDDPNIYPLF